MITQEELDRLLQFSPGPEKVLSLYLNVDQSQSENLNRGFETTLRNLVRDLENTITDPQELKKLQAILKRVQEFAAAYKPAGKSLAVICDESGGFFWTRSLQVPLQSELHWQSRVYIRPLIEARDEYQRYAVVITDRQRARLFTIILGEMEEEQDAFAAADVRKFDASGKDQMWSQMKFQHKADEHHKWHQKNVADILEKISKDHPFDRLLIAGPTEAVSELKQQLSHQMQQRLVGTFSIRLDSPETQVLEKAMELIAVYERKFEQTLLDDFISQFGQNHHAVAGVKDTLRAVVEGRVGTLLYAQNFRADHDGSQCEQCGMLLSDQLDQCPHCQGPVHRVPDLLGVLVEQTARQGGRVEQLRDDPAERMTAEAQGVGALLRF